jgi:hypothetical protein
MLSPNEERELKNLMLHNGSFREGSPQGIQRRAELLVKSSREDRIRLFQEVFMNASQGVFRFSK